MWRRAPWFSSAVLNPQGIEMGCTFPFFFFFSPPLPCFQNLHLLSISAHFFLIYESRRVCGSSCSPSTPFSQFYSLETGTISVGRRRLNTSFRHVAAGVVVAGWCGRMRTQKRLVISNSSRVQNGKVNMVWREMRSVDLQDSVGESVRSGRGRWGRGVVGLFREKGVGSCWGGWGCVCV